MLCFSAVLMFCFSSLCGEISASCSSFFVDHFLSPPKVWADPHAPGCIRGCFRGCIRGLLMGRDMVKQPLHPLTSKDERHEQADPCDRLA